MSPVTLNRLATQAARQFARVLDARQLNAQTVFQHYDAAAEGAAFDRNDRSTYPATDLRTRSFPALVHFVSDSTRGFGPAEYEVGDVLLFFKPAQDVSGAGAWFEIAGGAYVQKECGTLLAQDWSLEIGGRMIHRAMLLTRKRGQPETAGVFYVSGDVRVPLYLHAVGVGFLALASFDADKGAIVQEGAALVFSVEGQTAMRATAEGLFVTEIVESDTAPDITEPRLEFAPGGRWMATLTKEGVLTAPQFTEPGAVPAQSLDFELRLASGVWVASIGAAGTSAVNFSEFL